MKRILDIGTGDGIILMGYAWNDPNNLYVGIDYWKEGGSFASPEHIYTLMKGLVALNAKREHINYSPKPSRHKKHISNLLERIQSTRKTQRTLTQDKHSLVVLETIKKLERSKIGRKILAERVGDHIYPYQYLFWFLELFDVNPEIKDYSLKQFLMSDIPMKLEQYLRKLIKNISYIVADARKLPFRKELFDYVYSKGGSIGRRFGGFDVYTKEVTRVLKSGKIGTHYPSPEVIKKQFPYGIIIDHEGTLRSLYDKNPRYDKLVQELINSK